jgi:hypothetical protein
MNLPVTATAVIVSGRVSSLPRVTTLPRREVPGWAVIRATVGIRVRRRRWAIISTIWIIIATTRRGRRRGVVLHGSARRGPIAGAIIIVCARAALPVAVAISTRAAIAPWRAASVVIVKWRHGTTTASGGAGSATLALWHVRLRISYALHLLTLEFESIELLHSSFEIRGRFKLHESSAVGVSASLGVYHVEA